MLISLVVGFIIGLWAGSFFIPTWGCIGAVLFLGITVCIVGKKTKEALVISIFLCGVGIGLIRMNLSNMYEESRLSQFVNRTVSAEGIVVDEPDTREHNVKLTVKLTQVEQVKVSERILISVPLHPEFHYGDKLALHAMLQEPEEIDSDGRIFDYIHYLRVRNIWYIGKFARVELLSSGHGTIVKNALFKTKQMFTAAVNRAIPEPESSLLAGLLLGTKQSLGADLLHEFNQAGVSHMVVLSGYNIAIVAESIMALLVFLPSSLSFLVGAISILLFTMLAGGGASAIRAALMVLVALFAKHTHRTYTAARAFIIAVVLMLLRDPLLLVFDPSFQLSALATVGLIFVSPLIAPYLSWVSEKYGLREVVSSTIASQITVLPFLIYNTGVLSFVSLPVNVLVLGTVPVTMLLGFVTGAVGLISLYLSYVPALFAYILLWYQLTVVHLGAVLPFSAVMLPTFSVHVLLGVYLFISGSLYFLYKRKP